MDDPGRVRLSKSPADLRGDIHRFIQRQRSSLDPFLERLALVMGHHEVELPVRGLVDLVDVADVGVVSSRASGCVPLQTIRHSRSGLDIS